MLFFLKSVNISDTMQDKLILLSINNDDVIFWHQLKYKCFISVLNWRKLVIEFVKNSPELFSKLYCCLFSSKAVVGLTIRNTCRCNVPFILIKVSKCDRTVIFFVNFVVFKIKLFYLRMFGVVIIEELCVGVCYNLEVSFFVQNDSSCLTANGTLKRRALQVSKLNQISMSWTSFCWNIICVQIIKPMFSNLAYYLQFFMQRIRF